MFFLFNFCILACDVSFTIAPGQIITHEFDERSTVGDLQSFIANKISVPVKWVDLIHGRSCLTDPNQALEDIPSFDFQPFLNVDANSPQKKAEVKNETQARQSIEEDKRKRLDVQLLKI